MSRIGKLPVAILDGVEASVVDGLVKIKGPKGSLEKSFSKSHVDITLENNEINVKPVSSVKLSRAMMGTARSIINGMVIGVTEGYSKKLEINGVGFKAILLGQKLQLNLGYSHDIIMPIPEGITVKVDADTNVTVSGCDKQVVGQVAATIYNYYPVEPYKGKGVKIVGQFYRRKEGKKAG